MPCRRWNVCREMDGSGSHCRMLAIVAPAMNVWLSLMVVSAENWSTLHVGQVVGRAGRRDVALDVGRLERALGRRHLQRLQQRWVDDADDEGHEGPDADGQHRQGPTLTPDVEEQDGRREDRHVDEQQLGGQAGVDVGVAGAVDVAVLRVDEGPALQDVAGGLVQRDEGQQHRDVRLHRRSYPRQPPLGLDPAVEVVEDQHDGERHDQDGQRPVDDEGEEGSLKT